MTIFQLRCLLTKNIEFDSKVDVAVSERGLGELTAHRPPLPALTGIRFFAAMYVVFFHSHLPVALEQHHLPAAATLIRNGLLAVPLFFILSGFILSYTYESQIVLRGGMRRFWEARFARVWPLYVASLMLCTICMHTTPILLSHTLATMVMVQAWNPLNLGMGGSWNTVCWTLSTEALFYVVFPFLQLWLERRRTWVLILTLAVMLALAIGFRIGGINYEDTRGIRGVPLASLHLPEFIIGVCAGNLFLRQRSARNEIAGLNSVIVPGKGLITYLALIGSIWLLCQAEGAWTAWTALSFAVLLFCLAAESSAISWLLSTPILLIGGQISYGIYLLQWPCKAEVNRICGRAHFYSIPGRFVIDCMALILLSALAFYAVEEPARRLIRSFFARSQTTVQHSPARGQL